ncbi:hypothetical protein PV343_00240 [Streptomyces sp. WI03-4A]|uniref:hypothetical protein n=1 Tax=Streptomyces sp. WI03-4A TaxID=3028706 RepID=UPI0029A541B0|nr:hypothetical protein [Streptomyces sp. WI03-4A]MDX2590751.1 hypothetical protein [Streptomyces sp. WI03-4A]
MPWWRSRQRGAPRETAAPANHHRSPGDFLAVELMPADLQVLVRVIEHSKLCLEAHSGSDAATIRNASGAELPPLLYPRAGLALAWGSAGVPMLVSEIQHVEAAVINLESYGGHETVLCEGYGLLERLAELKGRAQEAQTVDGVLVLGAGPPRTACPGHP